MTSLAWLRTASARRRGPAVCAGALTAAACLLVTGCSSSPSATSATGSSAGGSSAGNGAAAFQGGKSAAVLPASAPAVAPGRAGGSTRLTGLPLSQDLIRTASLTVRSTDVPAAVSRAAGIVRAVGGYVSAEQTYSSRGSHTRAMISIQFKIPPGAYESTLNVLAALGTKLSETQQTQDVTQAVADVTSRVASAQAAIAQLRKLLGRAGTVGGLLTVQDQINTEEASLESLQSQQRALAAETSFATVSMVVEGTLPAITHHRQHKPAAGGFTGGLKAGWHALRAVAAALLTVAGAVLPFAVIAALLALGGYAARRRITRRRAGPGAQVTG
jgi:hypothetical protein